jgi:hypothetical protein
MLEFMSVLALAITGVVFVRMARPNGLCETVMEAFIVLCSEIIVIGYVLSALGMFGLMSMWTVGTLLFALLAIVCWMLRRPRHDDHERPNAWGEVRALFLDAQPFTKWVLATAGGTVLVAGVVNLGLVLFTAPHNWDSLAYHLARMAYYLQHGSMEWYDADYMHQVVQPRNTTPMVAYMFLAGGRSENATQLVQYLSYWVAMCSVGGMAKLAGLRPLQASFAALVFGLLPICLMQATTAQNDMFIAACAGVAAYEVFAFMRNGGIRHLLLSGVATGLGAGTKASFFLAVPLLFALGMYAIACSEAIPSRRLASLGVYLTGLAVAGLVFVLPAGYVENARVFGHPMGPKAWRERHSVEAMSLGEIVKAGSKNVLRYSTDFLSFDGMPQTRTVMVSQYLLRRSAERMLTAARIRLDTPEGCAEPFVWRKEPVASEDVSYWGILGFGLVWPAVLMGLMRKGMGVSVRILGLCALSCVILMGYVGGLYDQWRGRHLMLAAVFAVPVTGFCLQATNRLWRVCLATVVALGCFSALGAVVWRYNSALVPFPYYNPALGPQPTRSVFALDRVGQLTRAHTPFDSPFRRYEEIVPRDAVVAVHGRAGGYPEFVLFGDGLTRKLIPIRSAMTGTKPVPKEAEYLVYWDDYPLAETNDVVLGEGMHLRILKRGTAKADRAQMPDGR